MPALLYIHKLSDLNIKSAEIESVPLVRTMNTGGIFPFDSQKISQLFAESAVSEEDITLIDSSFKLVEPTIARLNAILAENDTVHEPVNLKRAAQCLRSISAPLATNLDYSLQVLSLQQEFANTAADLLNSIPTLKTREAQADANSRIGHYFETALRNSGFTFTYVDVIHEGFTTTIHDLIDSFRKGYMFHFTLEDELKKATFEDIKARIPVERLKESDELEYNIRQIYKGIEHALSLNMRMVTWAITFYSCIKLAKNR